MQINFKVFTPLETRLPAGRKLVEFSPVTNPVPVRRRGSLTGFSFLVFFFSLLVPALSAETDLAKVVESIKESKKTISMDLQDAELKDVLKIFSIQSGLNFIASDAVKDRKVTLYLENVPIKETMIKLFKANKLTYEYDEAAKIFIVNYLDDIREPELITRVFSLKYRSVSAANIEKEKGRLFADSSIISGGLSGGASSVGVSSAGVSSSAGANLIDAVKQLLSKNGRIVEDAGSNSLIITDLAGRFPMIEELIGKLDQPQPQVMLEVEILDVSKNLLDKLGFNLGDFSTAANPLSLIIGSGKSDFFIGNLANRGSTLKTTGIAGSAVIGNYYSALLNFLTQNQDTKFLARPRILTLNNESAEIAITKDEVMNLKTNRLTDTAGNISVDITYDRATSLALTPEGIGIFLRVTPQINMDTGEITMVVNPKTSSASDSVVFSTGTTTSFYRDPEVRSTKSIIKVKDGETVILGGMIHQEKQETKTKIPLLGDIPFLGVLFRSKNTTKNIERELVVFITPRIIKSSVVEIAQRPGNINNSSSAPAHLSQTIRGQEISDLLNTFEREKNIDDSGKVSQAGGAFN